MFKKIQKTLITTMCITLILCISTANVFAASDYLYLGISGVKQEQTNQCWDATSKSVIDYLGAWSPKPTQSAICKTIKGSVINQGANFYEDRDSFSFYNVTTTATSSTVSYGTIKDNIKGWCSPMKATIFWRSGGGHDYVIYGYYEDQYVQNVSYMNPWPDNPTWNSTTYRNFVSNSSWTWGRTFYYNHRTNQRR